jgi:hypothetical protein
MYCPIIVVHSSAHLGYLVLINDTLYRTTIAEPYIQILDVFNTNVKISHVKFDL